jgi:hypothetical protein
MSSSENTRDGPDVEMLLSLLGLVVLAYVFGTLSVDFQWFPYDQYLKPYFSTLAPAEKTGLAAVGDPEAPGAWQPDWHPGAGVTRDAPDLRAPGATLYSSSHRAEATLVDAAGNRLHRWRLPFSDVWPSPRHVSTPDKNQTIYWRRVHLFPDGDLLAMYAAAETSPQGFGLVKLDRHSEPIWRYSQRTHPALDVEPDGDILTLRDRVRDTDAHPVDGMPHLPDRILADDIVQLAPDGRELRRVSILDALARSPYRAALQMHPRTVESPGETVADVLHANSVARLGESFARHHDFAAPDDVVVSLRTLDVVAILDLQQRRVTWASRGGWWQPTDADPLPDGDLLVFDTNGHGAEGLASRLLEFDPVSERVDWMYTGHADQPFWSREGGSAQKLPGGNVLVTSPLAGRLQEITPDGTVAWEFRNPARTRRPGGTLTAAIWSGRRIPSDQLDFLD